MVTAVHALVLAGLLFPAVGRTGAAQVARDTSSLQFFGFHAGARLDELSDRVRSLGAGMLRCKRSRTDVRVSECRASVTDPALGGRVNLWVSAIDSLAGVMTLSGKVAPAQLQRWRTALQERYGLVGKRVQGTQSMLQWVRRGRMLRLTWRLEAGSKVASISLVDGRVLDDWGRSQVAARTRSRDSAAALSSKAGPDSSLPSPPGCSREPLGPNSSACEANRAPGSGSAPRPARGLGR
jgi:hypothetical protein